MAYKNTPLTGLSVKQIQILVEARNRPGVHTYYPGGHNVMTTSYYSRMQIFDWKDISTTVVVERTETLVPAIINLWKTGTMFKRNMRRIIVAISNVAEISTYTPLYDKYWNDNRLQMHLSNQFIFQIIALKSGFKFLVDGEELNHYDLPSFDYLNEYIELGSEGMILNPIIFHEYHLETPESGTIIDQNEYFVDGCFLTVDVTKYRQDDMAVLIDRKPVTRELGRLEYSFMFVSVGLLIHYRKTREKTLAYVMPPIKTKRFAFSRQHIARDITATLVTL